MPSKSKEYYPIHDLWSSENVTSTEILECIKKYPQSLNSYNKVGYTALDVLVCNPCASIESIQFLAHQVDRKVLLNFVETKMDMNEYLNDRENVASSLQHIAKRIHRHHKTKHGTNIAASSMDVVTGSADVTAAIAAAPIGVVSVAAAPVVLPVAAGVALGFGVCSLVTRVSSLAVQHRDKNKINREIKGTNETIRSLRIQDTILNALLKRDYHQVQQIRLVCNNLLKGIEVWDLPAVANLGFVVGKDYLTALDLMEVMLRRGSLAALFGGAASAGSATATATSVVTSAGESAGSSSTAAATSVATRGTTTTTTSVTAATTTTTTALATGATGALGAISALWALYNIPIDIDKLQNVTEIVNDLERGAEHAKRENAALKKWKVVAATSSRSSSESLLNNTVRGAQSFTSWCQ